MNYFVLTEMDESKWDDQAGIKYHFPHRYLKFLQPGTKIIYYKGRMQNKSFAHKRLSEKQHYFGYATIDQITSNGDNTYNASFRGFHLFVKAVPFKLNDYYIEKIPPNKKTNYWRDGVRQIDETIYTKILQLAGIEIVSEDSAYNDIALSDLDSVVYLEGGRKLINIIKYERNQELRDKAIEIHGYSCQACGFNFGHTYGEWGKGFIHIHHINPVAQNIDIKQVDPIKDLVPLCANCHAMVHRKKNQVLTIDELKKLIKTVTT